MQHKTILLLFFLALLNAVPSLSERTEKPSCHPHGYLCPEDGSCIAKTSVCDGKEDCPDGSDEASVPCTDIHMQRHMRSRHQLLYHYFPFLKLTPTGYTASTQVPTTTFQFVSNGKSSTPLQTESTKEATTTSYSVSTSTSVTEASHLEVPILHVSNPSCPESWDLYDGNCYFTSNLEVSWQEARQACKQINRKADLVSFHHSKEQEFISKKMEESMWIGLREDGNGSNYQWSDESIFDYRNWNEDIGDDNRDRCATLMQSGVWKVANCSLEKNYVCKFEHGERKECPEGFDDFMDSCYYFSRTKASWDTAREECQNLYSGSDLVSIHCGLVQSYLTDNMVWSIWLGLSNLYDTDRWQWSDTSLTNFISWREGQPSKTDKYHCAYLEHTQTWGNKNCSNNLKFACKMRPIDICPEGWQLHEGFCYFVSSEKATWFHSLELCKSKEKDSDLVSLHDSSSQNFLKDKMYWEIWTGLYYDKDNDQWKWTDNSPVDFNRLGLQPHRTEEKCAGLFITERWRPRNCQRELKFVCKLNPGLEECPPAWNFFSDNCYYRCDVKMSWHEAETYCQSLDRRAHISSLHSLTEQKYLTEAMYWKNWIGLNNLAETKHWTWSDGSQISFSSWRKGKPKGEDRKHCVQLTYSGSWENTNCNMLLNFACKLKPDPCPEGWQHFKNSCFHLSDFKAPWIQAKQFCKETHENAELPILNEEENNSFLLNYFRPTMWIKGTEGNCPLAIHSIEGSFEVVQNDTYPCTLQHLFACKYKTDICPERWEYYSNYCYYFSSYMVPWNSARELCKQINNRAELLSIDSDNEEQFILNKMVLGAWLGNTDYQETSDDSPTFENETKCIELTSDRSWTLENCLKESHFVCEISLDVENKILIDTSPLVRDITCPAIQFQNGGLDLHCFDSDGESQESCQDKSHIGTEAHFQCSEFYESTGSVSNQVIRCLENGSWSEKLQLSCQPVCGRSGLLPSWLKSTKDKNLKAEREQWPWHAGIYRMDTNNEWKYICGSSLISDKAVITAAHCVGSTSDDEKLLEDRHMKIVVGKNYRTSDDSDEFSQTREVVKIYRQYAYNSIMRINDLAILILKQPVKISTYVRPICFPRDKRHSLLFPGKIGVVSGWGTKLKTVFPNDLFLELYPVSSEAQCDDFYGLPEQIKESTFCAGFRRGSTFCYPNSGGAMVFLSADRRWYMEGVLSYDMLENEGSSCNKGEFSIFTRIVNYLDWIDAVLANADKDLLYVKN